MSSELARMLAPPQPPQNKAQSLWRFALFLPVVAFFSIFTNDSAAFKSAQWVIIPVVVVALGIGIILFVQLLFTPTQAQHDEYHAAMLRWDASHYCAREDVTFIPGEDNVLRPADFRALLRPG